MNKILESIQPVIKNSKNVFIDSEKLIKTCANINEDEVKPKKDDSESWWEEFAPFSFNKMTAREEVSFIIILDSQNFSYWGEPKWAINYQDKDLDGAWGMIASIQRAREEGFEIFNPCNLEKLDSDTLRNILRGNTEIPLFDERLQIFNEVGRVVNKNFDGDFINIVKEAKGDALNLLGIITKEISSYDDFEIYRGEKVFFQKRAQLAVGDIAEKLKNEKYCINKNLDELTACADYKLPQSLRKLGVIKYSRSLADKIDNLIEIQGGSDEEIEIRANTIWAVELIKEELKKKMSKVTALDIDHWLWSQGQVKSPNDKPYHRTRTIKY